MYLKQCKRFIWLIYTEWGKEKRWGEDDSISFPLSHCSGEDPGPASLHHCLEPPERFILKTFQAKTQACLARLVDGEVPILCPFSLLRKSLESPRRDSQRRHSPRGARSRERSQLPPFPGSVRERGRMTYRFVLTVC